MSSFADDEVIIFLFEPKTHFISFSYELNSLITFCTMRLFMTEHLYLIPGMISNRCVYQLMRKKGDF